VDKESLKKRIVIEFGELFNRDSEYVERYLVDVHFHDWG
jgi:hypothetical protein